MEQEILKERLKNLDKKRQELLEILNSEDKEEEKEKEMNRILNEKIRLQKEKQKTEEENKKIELLILEK
jgi:hypothetical protein